MTASQADFFAQATTDRPEPKRNQWGQYLIPDPDSGEEKAWVRATTWCKTVAETFALESWGLRQVALGLAARPDLVLLVKSIRDPEHPDSKKKLNGICKDAKQAAGSSTRANLGTALHEFAESMDMGLQVNPGQPYDRDLAAYSRALKAGGVVIRPDLMEQTIIVPELGVGGTLDRAVEWQDELWIGDLKTGRTLDFSWGEIAIQLAIYSRATHIFDTQTGELSPMPKVNQDHALVFHLPVGEGVCNVYKLAIGDAWDMAKVCGTVRAWRKRGADLAELVSTSGVDEQDASATADPFASVAGPTPAGDQVDAAGEPAPDLAPATDPFADDAAAGTPAAPSDDQEDLPGPSGGDPGAALGGGAQPSPGAPDTFTVPADRTEWAKQRLQVIKANDAAKQMTAECWPRGVAPKPPWTDDELDAILHVLVDVEAEHGLPFPEQSDPGDDRAPAPRAVASGRPVSKARVAELKALAKDLDADGKATLLRWMKEGNDLGWTWDLPTKDQPVPSRLHAVLTAGVILAGRVGPEGDDAEPLARAILSIVWDDGPWQSTWATGAAIGALSTNAAKGVVAMADSFANGDQQATSAIGQAAVLDP